MAKRTFKHFVPRPNLVSVHDVTKNHYQNLKKEVLNHTTGKVDEQNNGPRRGNCRIKKGSSS